MGVGAGVLAMSLAVQLGRSIELKDLEDEA